MKTHSGRRLYCFASSRNSLGTKKKVTDFPLDGIWHKYTDHPKSTQFCWSDRFFFLLDFFMLQSFSHWNLRDLSIWLNNFCQLLLKFNSGLSESVWVAITKYHRWSRLINKRFHFSQFLGLKFKIRVPGWSGSSES